jgi:hypothetical protein
MTLITNLIFSDFLQSLGFLIEFRWLQIGYIKSGSAACSAQGHFIQMGDLATAMFVILIAANTALHIFRPSDPRVPPRILRCLIALVWLAALLMSTVPVAFMPDFYSNAGVWCWIGLKYSWQKLYLHYIFLLLAAFVSLIIYPTLGIYLLIQGRIADSHNFPASGKLVRVAKTMFLYPMSYTLGTLPLATIRIKAMAGIKTHNNLFMGACIVFSMLGGINCLIYIGTRKHILAAQQEEMAQQREQDLERQQSALQKKLELLGGSFDEAKVEAYYPGLVFNLDDDEVADRTLQLRETSDSTRGSLRSMPDTTKKATPVTVKAVMIDDDSV